MMLTKHSTIFVIQFSHLHIKGREEEKKKEGNKIIGGGWRMRRRHGRNKEGIWKEGRKNEKKKGRKEKRKEGRWVREKGNLTLDLL